MPQNDSQRSGDMGVGGSVSGGGARPPRILAALFAILGIVLAAGGVRLLALGGSLYYAIAGVALLASGVLLWRANPWGARIYALLTLGTMVWAVAEAGFDGWRSRRASCRT